MNIHLGIAVGVIVLVLVLMGLGLVSFNKGTSWQEQFPEFVGNQKNVQQCGNVIVVSAAGGVDVPFVFYDIISKKELGVMGFWECSYRDLCAPPKEWECGVPKNYR